MHDPNEVLAQQMGLIRKPSLGERITRWLGFRFPAIPDTEPYDDDPSFAPGYIVQEFTLVPTLRDRFLILLGGSIASRLVVKTDAAVRKQVSMGEWSVIAPGERF